MKPPGVEKHHQVKCLILGGGGDIVFSQSGQKPFWFLFAGQMILKPFELFAMSPEPGDVTALRGQRRVLPPDYFREPVHRCISITSAISIYEPLFVCSLFDHMSTHFHKSLLAWCCFIAVFLTGCATPRPQSFVDADALPSNYAGRGQRAFTSGGRLIVEVSQIPGVNVAGLDAFEQDGALYLSPRRISSGGGGTRRFEVDVSKFQVRVDWSQHVYWLLEEYAYPIFHPGFWSSEKRLPWPRKKMEIVTQ